ncbi:YdcF family protein [Timonella senegalensis]|uniref:YdcF family protein n=1 Tax=Timonella senegalensis TaxID=1465825 RepID=UPI0028AE4263|nr:YdcF family protein [Timonella senegalensis]
MQLVLLLMSLGFLGFGIWGFLKDRTAFRYPIFAIVGILGIIVWISVRFNLPFPVLLVLGLGALAVAMSFPVLVVFLLANGLVMFRREARTLGNLLSLLAGVGLFFLAWSMTKIFNQYEVNGFLAWTWFFVAATVAYISVAFLLYLLMSWLYSAVPTRVVPTYGIVLGSRLIKGEVPPLLRARLDKALELYRGWSAKGKVLTLIPSGGQGPDESRPEGVAMGEYLENQGVPPEHILVEDRAVNTLENLRFSRDLMADPNSPAIVVTNNYHVFRAAMLCRKLGIKAHVHGSRTALYYLPSAVMREFIAIMAQYKWLNVAVIGALFVMCASAYVTWLNA